jgi:hypothetical protein
MADDTASRPAANVLDIVVDRSNVAVEGFLGFGCEWDPLFWHDFNRKAGVTDADWTLVRRRVEFMRLPIVRMMMLVQWCYREGGQFDWDSNEMKSLYAHLDVCQRQGIAVILTDWGVERWAHMAGVEKTEDPAYADAIGTYLAYLRNTRGYTCIRYFVLVNEPNYEVKSFVRWRQGLRNVANALARRGLDREIILLGPDAGQGDLKWLRPTAGQLADILGGYDLHMYADPKMIEEGRLEEFFRTRWQAVAQLDPAATGKLRVIGEAGLADEISNSAGHRRIGTYEYGLGMADYAVQAARSGSHVISAWMLDDTNHEGFFWGLWSDKKGGLALRPWFFVWSLLSRYHPAGSTLYRVDSPAPGVRVLASCVASSNGPASAPSSRPTQAAEGWTFCVVNRSDAPVSLQLRVPDGPHATLRQYVYQENRLLTDKDGLPKAAKRSNVNLADGLTIDCPPAAFVIATSLPE